MERKRKKNDQLSTRKRKKADWEQKTARGPKKTVRRISRSSCVKVVSFNCNGYSEVSQKDIKELIRNQNPGVVGILETKLRQEDGTTDVEIEGYDAVDVRRSDLAGDKAGGGILVFTRQEGGVKYKQRTFKVRRKENSHVQTERVWITAKAGGSKIAYGFVYVAQQKSGDEFGRWNDSLYEVLGEEVLKLRAEGYKIHLAGDMNGWVGAGVKGVKDNDPRRNPNGERLLDFLEATNMKFLNGTECCTGLFTRHGSKSSTVLDYVCVAQEDKGMVRRMVIDEFGTYGGASDHVMIITTVEVGCTEALKVKAQVNNKTVWNIDDKTDWTEFSTKLDGALANVTEDQKGSIDELGEALKAAALSTLEETLGRRNPGEGVKKKR